MTARVLVFENAAALRDALEELGRDIDAGGVRALVMVVARGDGGLEPWWGAERSLGVHAGTMLRGMVAYLGAVMDSAALNG